MLVAITESLADAGLFLLRFILSKKPNMLFYEREYSRLVSMCPYSMLIGKSGGDIKASAIFSHQHIAMT